MCPVWFSYQKQNWKGKKSKTFSAPQYFTLREHKFSFQTKIYLMKNWIILIDEETYNSTEWTMRPHVSEPWSVSLQFQLHLSKVSVIFSNQTIVIKMAVFFSFIEYGISLNSLQYKD